jgi:hypothetical protein
LRLELRELGKLVEHIHGDTVGDSLQRQEFDLALVPQPRRIVVGGDGRQSVDRVASVNRQQRIDGAAGCVQPDLTVSRCDPVKPDRAGTCIAGVVWLARFLAGIGAVAIRGNRRARQSPGAGKGVIGGLGVRGPGREEKDANGSQDTR